MQAILDQPSHQTQDGKNNQHKTGNPAAGLPSTLDNDGGVFVTSTTKNQRDRYDQR